MSDNHNFRRRKTDQPSNSACPVNNVDCQFEVKIQRTYEAIYGKEDDSDPSEGLYWMVTENTKFISLCRSIFWPVLAAVLVGSASAFGIFIKDVFFTVYMNKV